MLIPSIDLQGGRIVQLVQGERLAIETSDVDGWIGRFRGAAKIQLVDLDGAKGAGSNEALVERIASQRGSADPLRRLARGGLGILALFRSGLTVAPAGSPTARLARIIAAVDSRAGRVVVNGWRSSLELTPVAAVRQLEPYVGEFLYTHVDREGLLQGTDLSAIEAVRAATTRAVSAAGGITTREEIDYLASIEVDAVVGMALYTGRLSM